MAARALVLAIVTGCTFDPGAAAGQDARHGTGSNGDGSVTPSTVIAFDAVSQQAITNSSSLSWMHAVGPGLSNSLLVVGVAIEKNSAVVSSIMYNDVPLIEASTEIGGANVRAELWYLTAPAAGNHQVVVKLTSTVGSDGAVGGAASFSGVDQTTPLPTIAIGGGHGEPSTAITTKNDRAWLVDVVMFDNGANLVADGAGQIRRWTTGQMITGAGSTLATTARGSYAMSWMTASDNWAQIVAEINP